MKDEKHQKKKKNTMLLCSMNFLFWKARRDEWTNDSSSAEQVSHRVPYNVSQKKHNEEYKPNS